MVEVSVESGDNIYLPKNISTTFILILSTDLLMVEVVEIVELFWLFLQYGVAFLLKIALNVYLVLRPGTNYTSCFNNVSKFMTTIPLIDKSSFFCELDFLVLLSSHSE
jgi:hypothetical protein